MSVRKAVLVVEDEFFAARDLHAAFQAAGYLVLGPVKTEDEALAVLDKVRPDAAILDLNLGGRRSMGVVAALDARGIPFCIATGYSPSWIPPGYRSRPYLLKPYHPKAAVDLVGSLISSGPQQTGPQPQSIE